jgi:hypothetical protein
LPHLAFPLAACSTVMPRAHDEINTDAAKRITKETIIVLMVYRVLLIKNELNFQGKGYIKGDYIFGLIINAIITPNLL